MGGSAMMTRQRVSGSECVKASIMAEEEIEYTITWFIENYSYCWHRSKEKLDSPEFILDELDGTVWYLTILPRGYGLEKDYISISLCRGMDAGQEEIPLQYELFFLSADGTTFTRKEFNYTFERNSACGDHRFLLMDDFLSRKSDYLPQDTLSVCCRMRKRDVKTQQKAEIVARTRVGIEKFSFLHVTENFSTFQPNEVITLPIPSMSDMVIAFSSRLYISNHPCCYGQVIMEIKGRSANQILSSFRISLLDASDKVILYRETETRLSATRWDIQKLSLSLTKQAILSKKDKYLPGDKLSLRCECTFSTGLEFQIIESTILDSSLVGSNLPIKNDQNKEKYGSIQLLSPCYSALDDFADLYNNPLLTDMELKTKTKSFPSHKIVLCARSSVFKAILTNDMKEKHTDCIEIDDLEDDTVQQLLLFLYSDQLEKLEWESAIKLYYAGDKYAIQKLKVICASFLVKHMSTSNAIELLLLADTHNDSDLKNYVEDLIFEYEEEIFGSKQWRNLIKTNPTLVSETMCRKYV